MLNASADRSYVVTPSCAGATVSPASVTIAAGQNSGVFTVTAASAGSYSVDFGISPTLSRAGNPRALTVSAASAGPSVAISATSTQTVAFTFGQAFKAGDIPSGQYIGSSESELDAVVLNRWSDGSVKFALVSGSKALTAGVPASISLAATATAPGGSAITTSQLVATGASASISFGSATASWGTADWPSPFRQVSSGRQMSSWHYRKALGSDPHLVAWLEVRCYKSGAVEVLPWIENGYLTVASPVVKRGRAVFTLGGTTRYDSISDANTPGAYTLSTVIDGSGVLSLQHHARAVLVRGGRFSHWLGTDPGLTIAHDRAYLASTKMVWAYYPTAVAEASLASLNTNYNPGRVCYMEIGMGATGYAQEIGMVPNTSALYLISGDPRAYQAMMSTGFSLANYSIHYRDEATNRPLLFTSHPTRSMATDTGLPMPDGVNSAIYASSHHPAAAYLPYLLTGWNWFVEEIQFQVTDHYLARNQTYRKNATYYFYPSAYGYSHNEQGGLRAQGWQWRTTAMAASITPEADTAIRGQFITVLNYNATKFRTEYESGDTDNPYGANVLGVGGFGWEVSGMVDSDPEAGWKIWQDAFFTASIGLTWDLDLVTEPTAKANLLWLRDFKYKAFVSVLGRSGVPSEYGFTRAANYQNVKVGQNIGSTFVWRTNWADIWTATWGSPNTDTSANTLTGGNAGSPTGFADSYWGNIQPAIAYAVSHGATGALAGYNRMIGASNWSLALTQWQSIPVWAIKPAI